MTIHLDNLPAEQPEQSEPEQRFTLTGDALASECKRAVRLEVGPWGTTRGRASDCERDALWQTLALYCLEHPRWYMDRESGEPLVYEQRRAYLRLTVRHLLRDSREWQDSLEDRPPTEQRRTARKVIADASTAEQAKRFRTWERERKSAPLTSMEVLTHRHTSSHGHVDWLEVAGDRGREQDAGEQLPALALAAHSPDLAERMAERVTDALTDAGVSLDRTARETVLVALLVANGEPLESIRSALGVSIATAKRRSAAGMETLRLAHRSLGVDLVSIRRDCVAAMQDEDREICPDAWQAASTTDVDAEQGIAGKRAAVDAAIAEQRKRTALRMAGSESRASEHRHGSARDVLGYIARLERAASIMERPAVSIQTDDARPAVKRYGLRTLSSSHGPALRCWQPASDARKSGTAPHAWIWPDTLYGGQAGYSRNHPALYCSAAWTWSDHAPVAPLVTLSYPLTPAWREALAERRAAAALTLARRIAREPNRARRVCRLLRLAGC